MGSIRHLGLLTALLFSTAGHATSYSSLYTFGDSLVDSGNARIGSLEAGLPDPASPSLGYADGRFSNGWNFADYLSADLLGHPATAYLAGGTNFAVGGALTAYSPTETSPSFLSQLSYFSSSGQTIDSNSLVLVAFGGNDIRSVLTNNGNVDFSPAAADLTTGLSALIGAGARNIVVVGSADIGGLPSTVALSATDPNISATATDRTQLLNNQFSNVASLLSQQTGANVQFFDLAGLEAGVLADPAAFGLPATLNTTTPCQAAGTSAILSGCNGFLYFDAIHPTTQVHNVIAQAIEGQLTSAVPEPSTWTMMLVGFGLLGAFLRSRQSERGGQAFA